MPKIYKFIFLNDDFFQQFLTLFVIENLFKRAKQTSSTKRRVYKTTLEETCHAKITFDIRVCFCSSTEQDKTIIYALSINFYV